MARPAAVRLASAGALLTGLPGVTVVIAVLLVLAGVLLPDLLVLPAVTPGWQIPLVSLALMFGVVEVFVLHIQVRREAQTVSLHELALVLGLFFASPLVVLAARLIGPLPVLVLHRRQAPVKIVFNMALFAADTAVALTVFRLFPVSSISSDGWAWTATGCAVVAACAVAATATTLVIAAYEGRLQARDLWALPLRDAPRALAVALPALIAVYALSLDPSAWVPLLAVGGVILLAYRAYASLAERHLSLERLYRFSQAVSTDPEVEGVLRSVLLEAKELLRAESAHVLFLPPGNGPAAYIALTAADRLVRRETDVLLQPGWVDARVVGSGVGELLSRTTKDDVHRRLLHELGAREAVIAPLRGEAGVVGTITVSERLGDIRTFDEADLRLLETVANHASIALRNGRLVDQLRHDSLHDALTGLPNRNLLLRSVSDALSLLEQGIVPGIAVMIMDLDGFKEVNDTLGHQQGDALLREVAGRLVGAAGEGAVVARLGGDEFAVLL
ncbi:MAG: putative Diguanylate cyclase/phosphodiesterase, partial [Frankiales bacterium]|nr:putative Diguanylate cyclase/phosphodiesterase [Frankiales bacterium]